MAVAAKANRLEAFEARTGTRGEVGAATPADAMEKALLAIVRLFVKGLLVYRERPAVEVRAAVAVGAAAERLRRVRARGRRA
jgi:hypothetical protein